MIKSIITSSSENANWARCVRRGFSFTEVLFAVMILGIGFIMVAGIFPVAISQTASTQEETVGAAAAPGAVATYNTLPGLIATIPADGQVTCISGTTWDLIRGNQILPDDPKFGWAALIKRNASTATSPNPMIAQLIVIPCQVRGRAAFDVNDITMAGSGDTANATLLPMKAKVRLVEGVNNPDTIEFISGTGVDAAVTGAVVVLANGADAAGRSCAGRIFRLAAEDPTVPHKFELAPGNDMTISPGPNGVFDNGSGDDVKEEPVGTIDAFVVGRAVAGPRSATPTFEGPSIATGAYVTFISLK